MQGFFLCKIEFVFTHFVLPMIDPRANRSGVLNSDAARLISRFHRMQKLVLPSRINAGLQLKPLKFMNGQFNCGQDRCRARQEVAATHIPILVHYHTVKMQDDFTIFIGSKAPVGNA
jgi:hypothetical protein